MGNEKSALIYAAASGHTETVRMLENVGADIHKKENETTQDEIELVSPVAGQASVLKAEYTETKRVECVVQEKNGVKEAVTRITEEKRTKTFTKVVEESGVDIHVQNQ